MTSKKCPDCQVDVGEAHDNGCDVAQCLMFGEQRLMHELEGTNEEHNCGRDVWTGRWPGEAECEEFGWWARWVPGQPGWVRCEADAPDARLDLNRLATDARWDPATSRWVQK